jgi:peptide deformylase
MGNNLPIRYYGHKDLRVKAAPVEKLTPEVISLCQAMVDKMVSMSNCIGFAGPQLGILLRIFVIREEIISPDNTYVFKDPEVIINPVLSSPSQSQETSAEGCMSLPGLHVKVTRPESIHVRYQNLKGEFVEEHLSDFRARMFMHENDHLNGVLIIDRIDEKERKRIEPLLRAMKEKYS